MHIYGSRYKGRRERERVREREGYIYIWRRTYGKEPLR